MTPTIHPYTPDIWRLVELVLAPSKVDVVVYRDIAAGAEPQWEVTFRGTGARFTGTREGVSDAALTYRNSFHAMTGRYP